MLTYYQRQVLQAIWYRGPMSRWELHKVTGMTPNQAGETVGNLLEMHLLREGKPQRAGRGRPAVPLYIEEAHNYVLGLTAPPGQVAIHTLNLIGEPITEPKICSVEQSTDIVPTAARLLGEAMQSHPPVAIGLALPGFVDPSHRAVISSATWGGAAPASDHLGQLDAIYEAAGHVPIVLENDMHALTARWLLTHPDDRAQDLLVLSIEDGRFGGSQVVGGRPNRGCVTGGNEMGHMRFFADTELCYCGQRGCLERIVSTEYLHRIAPEAEGTLPEHTERYRPGEDAAIEPILEYLVCGLSNIVNFVRPEQLILVSSLLNHQGIREALLERTLARVFSPIGQRVRIECNAGPNLDAAENAGWLAIAELLEGEWSSIK
jgi:predicted NBD/HSP70 family sugar kinase